MANNEIIQAMSSVKIILDRIITDINADDELKQIYESVSQYLETQCEHHIVEDYIDVTPYGGYTVHFCDICMKTFDR
jgi:hypothetical protein